MAFEGYLIKVGGDEFPLTFVKADSYSIYANRRLDLNPTRAATGKLERTVLDHRASTISFTVRALDNNQLNELMSFLNERYVIESERKLILDYYCPDINDYKTGEFYVPDINFPINTIDYEKKIIHYKEFTLEFIEY
jgi:hypothetical protein